MFLMKRGPAEKQYLYLVDNEKDENGKLRKKTVKSFGKISDIPADKLEEIYRQYQQPVAERKLAQKIIREESLKELMESVSADTDDTSSPNFNKLPLLHYGHLILKPIWDKLGLS